ncbi:MAG: MmgE/PrpD family protein [Chloroflexi bacterium]|nr:MmgE/PrpD family protein [Chloroflexota bacterium]
MPHTVATVVVKRRVALADFLPEALGDPAVLEMARKVSAEASPEFPEVNFRPGITEIRTKTGNIYSKRVNEPYGSPFNPILEDRMVEKFRECASHAVKPLPEKRLQKVIDLVLNLEEQEDVGRIVRLLG